MPSLRRARLPRNVVVLAAVSLLTDAASEMIYPLLPVFLSTVIGASAMAVGTIEGAAETAAALLKLASGWWSDRLRRRKPLVVFGYALATLVRPLVAFAQSTGQVLAIRVTDRVGKGIRTSPRDALIADSVAPGARGLAFGFHRASDHLGAVIGPLLAFALLRWGGLTLRHLFLMALIPGLFAVAAAVFGIRETPRAARTPEEAPEKEKEPGAAKAAFDPRARLSPKFWAFLALLFLFTLGNSTDAFLLLRASQLGVPAALIPILWAMLHVVKSLSSTPGGALSDRVGRKPLIIAGWLLYTAVYWGFGRAGATWHAWTLFAIYGIYFGLTEGVEKALVADLVPAERRGTAFGWYNLALGLGALPASVIFGWLWDARGPAFAFGIGATAALSAAIGVALLVPRRPNETAPAGV
ncbi:MAG TPA: MFS transporter [Thermoanaerobaculia bacterium]|nr:MFS transporter [Thermoanaerobaculia bacterium]